MVNNSWGGDWTEQKLEAFVKYVNAYLTILNHNKTKYNWETIYFDGFAGSGERGQKDETFRADLFFSATNEEENLYQSAAERILSLEQLFDWYYFIDLNKNAIEQLQSRLSGINNIEPKRLQFRSGDCNKFLLELADIMKTSNKYAALVLLDPFGMQINWKSIEKLKNTRTDLWILVPTGVIVNRLLDREGKLLHLEKLISFFGLTEQEIREEFYHTFRHSTLFEDEIEVTSKVDKPINKIINLYIRRLKEIFTYVTKSPLVLRNSKNVPLFHFAFASNNQTGLKIAKDIIGKDNG
ncbi:hypothetical protein SMSP2_02526 [Limihaloglobus sulfuriphilus]|uniref:Three-Cys-motif partner protein TcmP n=1 Tax=Limihaloglobus sulfuriphilus TaxID=1851148 RepID=A0A1Q2MHF9_9BACT|nr:three-Cys-motif partner protein TcmP [Limihaloglobus sulfuriphilus]AQQ72145.1 hypothetical protein SMSP2_02526 [Limihaloglobus sulfuriphilus]